MTAENRASKSKFTGPPHPPGLAKSILSFFLPAASREPILGDLEEEFTSRIFATSNFYEVYRWYWWQALQSSCLFFWQQRGTGMAYLISVIFFVFMIALALMTSQFGLWLISPPVIILTVPTALILGIGATSFQAAKSALKMSFSDSSAVSTQEVKLATRFLRVTGNQFLLVAGVAFFLGIIQVLLIFSQNPDLMNSSSHYARYGIAMLPLFYGMIFKCLFYSAEQKLLWKYAAE